MNLYKYIVFFLKKEIDLKQWFTIIVYVQCISYKRNNFRYATNNTLDNMVIYIIYIHCSRVDHLCRDDVDINERWYRSGAVLP
jgi:hypothetical protein